MKQLNIHIFFISFVAALGGFLFGYDLVVISGAVIFLKEHFALTTAGVGFATASAVLGCIIGPLVGGWLSDRIGRKMTLLIACVLFALSAIGTALPKTIDEFNFYRIIGGVGCGIASVASPMYIAEIAPAFIRGRLLLMYQLAIVVGAFAATLVSYFLSFYEAWRWMFASELVPLLVFGVLILTIPRSPRWLAQKGRSEEALTVLKKINGPERSEGILKEIQESLAEESGSYSELFKPGVRYAFLVAMLLAILNQVTGWTLVAYYLPILFQKSGFEEASDAIFQYVLVNGINICLTFISIYLVDRIGRRPLWLVTSLAMMVGVTTLGLVFHLHITGVAVLLAVLMCGWPHIIGIGPLPWVMMSEVLPTRIRAKAISLCTMVLWICVFSGTSVFPIVIEFSENLLGSPAAAFWMFNVTCLFAFFFGLKMLPETKGKTLEELSQLWKPSTKLN